jgi:hypothetical protein
MAWIPAFETVVKPIEQPLLYLAVKLAQLVFGEILISTVQDFPIPILDNIGKFEQKDLLSPP